MTKEEIAQLLKSIKENEAISKAEIPSDVPFHTVAVYDQMRVRASEYAYEKKQQYKEYVVQHLGGILLKGPYEKQKEFAALAEKVGATITFDSREVYMKLTDTSFGMMGGTGNMTADQVALVFTEVRLFARELALFRLRDPDFQWMFSHGWSNPADFSNGFRRSLFLTNGLRLTYEAMIKKVFEDSLATPIARTTIPVVILGMLDEEEDAFKEVLAHGYTVVDLNKKDVDEQLVKDTFVTLRDTIKAKATR